MSEEKIEEAMKNAVGNNRMEGYDVSSDEQELITRVLKKYEGEYGEQAIHSLLYGITKGTAQKEGESNNAQYKK